MQKEEVNSKSDLTRFLCIESSCDDTSVAVLEGGPGDEVPRLLGMSVQSQQEVHQKYGGVVPELASRAHLQNLIPCLQKALDEAGSSLSDMDFFSATGRPGLVGSLLIGHTAAKTLAMLFQKPFVSCNHLEGHRLSIHLEEQPEFPYLSVIVSGGHTSLYHVKSLEEAELVGVALDDAAGEAFDKGAKLLGLGFPGGPQLEKLARAGDSEAYAFSRPKVGGCDFSFSGLKSEFVRFVQKEKDKLNRENAAASYQRALIDHLTSRIEKAIETHELRRLVLVGGVARNQALRDRLEGLKQTGQIEAWYAPHPRFCTDNAAMVGVAAFRLWKRGEFSDLNTDVSSTHRPSREMARARKFAS